MLRPLLCFGNATLWKIFSCWSCFRMPPIKSSRYILLRVVLVVFPPLTLLNLRALFPLAKTLDCHWQGWCKITEWECFEYSTRARQWGIISIYSKAGTLCFLLSVGAFHPTYIELYVFLIWEWAHGHIFQCVWCPILWHLNIWIFSWTSVTSSVKIVNGTNNQWENTCYPSRKLLSNYFCFVLFYLVSFDFMKHIC